MKKTAVLFFFLIASAFGLSAQKFYPRETWPYILENFAEGAVRTSTGALISSGTYNVSVVDGSLHYIVDSQIMKVDMSKVYTAKVGEDTFVNLYGRMYKVLSELDKGYVLEGVVVDYEELGKVNIGYGISSSSASARNVSTLLEGSTDMVSKKIETASTGKYDGKEIPVDVIPYVYVSGRLIEASKQEVASTPGVDKDALKAFLKENKIKWNKTESLEKVVVFLATQFNK